MRSNSSECCLRPEDEIHETSCDETGTCMLKNEQVADMRREIETAVVDIL